MTMWLGSLVLATIAWLLGRTWRLEVIGNGYVEDLRRRGIPVVFAVWHANLLVPLWHRRGEAVTLLVSGHRDAEYLARAAQSWGYSVVRGSSTRGGVTGLKKLMRTLMSGGDVAFTPDGPRGPKGIAKPGALRAALRGGGAVVPVGAFAPSCWQLRSWDRFTIPRPFSPVRLVYGQPVMHAGEGETARVSGGLLTEHLDRTQEAAQCG
jgi:lysophospholipid acyltransferase (LPLAT)-like uncharacterized protein